MATMKDIAREAGVSHGTVSNVLNGKSNVTSEKILRVKKAAKKLGYTINESAKILRQGHNKKLAVLLPNINAKLYTDFYEGFRLCAQKNKHSVELFIIEDNYFIEKKLLKT